LTEAEQAMLTKHAAETKTGSVVHLTGGDAKTYDKYASPWISYALGQIESERAKVGWTTYAHTEQPVITYAAGPGAHEFAGHYDNTDIAKKMAKLLGLTLEAPKAK
jgi:alkaline phosphatase